MVLGFPILLAAILQISFTLSHPLETRSSNGPVISSNFQDPGLIKSGNTYYAFSGPNGNPGVNVQVATSSDFSSWYLDAGYDVLPYAGPWAASPPHVWAPDVNQLPDGTFVLYYTAAVISSPGMHCVGAAVSTSILGPYSPFSSPITCDLSSGGSIDPDGFTDPASGNMFIVYKVDGNSVGHGGACNNGDGSAATPIILQQVQRDGYTPVGPAIQIITNEASDGAGIEAPSLFYDRGSGQYVLMFNAGCFTNTAYRIEYATATSIEGPYTRKGPFIVTGSTAGKIQLPGGIDVLGSSDSRSGIVAVLHGDLNPGWFAGDGSKRVRGMYAVQLGVGGGIVNVNRLY